MGGGFGGRGCGGHADLQAHLCNSAPKINNKIKPFQMSLFAASGLHFGSILGAKADENGGQNALRGKLWDMRPDR